MAGVLRGIVDWDLARDDEGYRDYTLKWKVETDNPLDGPTTVLLTPGLPLIGTLWTFGNDVDPWAFCLPNTKVTPMLIGERQCFWMVEQKFSNRPQNRCQDTSIDNPLDEPPRVGGSFVKYTKEVSRDREGKLLLSSSQELYQGAKVERDYNRPTVWVELTQVILPLSTFSGMVDTVNDASIWGLEPRMAKLSNASWERRLYGVCNYYYITRYEFDIDFETFTLRIPDYGTKYLPSFIDPLDSLEEGTVNWKNPDLYCVYKDKEGENSRVLLNGKGQPLQNGDEPHMHEFELYNESNFLLLNVPTSF